MSFQMRWNPESLTGWALDEVLDDGPPEPQREKRKSYGKRKPLHDPRQVTFDQIGWRPTPVEPEHILRLPTVRSECEGAGVCLKLSCRYNTTVDITPTGSIHLNAQRVKGQMMTLRLRSMGRVVRLSQEVTEAFEDRVAERLAGCESNCALDAVAREPDGMTLEAVGDELGVTREDVRQTEEKTLRKLREECDRAGIKFRDFLESWRDM